MSYIIKRFTLIERVISLDWLKKWFSFFQDEEETQNSANNSREIEKKEIQTKVIFQYPKTSTYQWNDGDLNSRLKLRRRKERSKAMVDEEVTTRTLPTHKEGTETEIRRLTVRDSNRQFLSPIYGYHRKNTNGNAVEIELTGIESDKNLNNINERPSNAQTLSMRESLHEEPMISERLNQENRIHYSGKETVFSELKESHERIHLLYSSKENEVNEPIGEKQDDINVSHDQQFFDHNELQGKEERSESLLVNHNESEHPFNRPFLEQINHRKEETNESLNQGNTNKEIIHTKSVQNNQVKKHIPFNVIMLKKDKEALKKTNQLGSNKPFAQKMNYQFPGKHLLNVPAQHLSNERWVNKQAELLNRALQEFHVDAKVVGASEGPSVTRFEISPGPGVKVNKITNLIDDLKLSLAAKDIRIEAPIPGKHTVGIEVPNKVTRTVYLREILDHPTFREADSPLTVALGLDISGKPIVLDLKKMPHGLIAGATGSGKSVCIHSFLISLLYKATPEEVKLLLIDPKMVELAQYNDIPHLVCPVVTDSKEATATLKWAVEEMERRYETFAKTGVRDIVRYNEKNQDIEKMPYIVIVIDELADLMMVAPADVEESICRIAQKARACGIHLLIATQRPSVDVITGLIKANIPTRIAFSVSSQVDSRTIIDSNGAERLLGKGDMLFLNNGTAKPIRLQGPYISDQEIEQVVDHVRSQGSPQFLFKSEEIMKKLEIVENDELFLDACYFAVEQGAISTSSLQRHFRIGYNRAARLIEIMEEKGIISESKGSKPRDVLISVHDLEKLM